MTATDRLVVGGLALLFGAAVTFGVLIPDYREGKERMVFMGQCIEKWSVDRCETWDKYGRRDLAFRKDR